MIAVDARRLVPVRSGALKKSITYRTSRRGRQADERQALVGFKPPTSRRAHFTEFGTVHSAAKPFMRPALDANGNRAMTAIGKELNKFIESYAWRTNVGFELTFQGDFELPEGLE